MNNLEEYQKRFVNLLVKSEALRFGEFVTKSGRNTPYFINTGCFNDGKTIEELGSFYAEHINRVGLSSCNVVFGPAYKGIPLAVATSSAMQKFTDKAPGFAFNRKETKGHGDQGIIVGHPIEDGAKIVIVEDVITAGTTFKEVVPFLKSLGDVEIHGAVISVDRQEKGAGELSAVQEVSNLLDLKIYPIVTITQIIDYLSDENSSGFKLSQADLERIKEYRSTYGA